MHWPKVVTFCYMRTVPLITLPCCTSQVTLEAEPTMMDPHKSSSVNGSGLIQGSSRSGKGGAVEVSDITLPAGLQYRLQTHTLKRYGLNDAFDRSVAHLLHQVRGCDNVYVS